MAHQGQHSGSRACLTPGGIPNPRSVGVGFWARCSPADITVQDDCISRSSNVCRVCRSITTSTEALTWALEVAAQQLISQRLRTHYGGAVQTFAALEKGLQSRLSKCRQAEELRQPVPGVHRPAIMRRFLDHPDLHCNTSHGIVWRGDLHICQCP